MRMPIDMFGKKGNIHIIVKKKAFRAGTGQKRKPSREERGEKKGVQDGH